MPREKFNPSNKAETIPQDSVISAKEPNIDNAIPQNIEQGKELGTASAANTDRNNQNEQAKKDVLERYLKKNPDDEKVAQRLHELNNSSIDNSELPQTNDKDSLDKQKAPESLAADNPDKQQFNEASNSDTNSDRIRQTDNLGDFTPELRQAQNNDLVNQLSGESSSTSEPHKLDRDGVETSKTPCNNSDLADSLSESLSPPQPSSTESSNNYEFNEA